jgi:hypothetical protein
LQDSSAEAGASNIAIGADTIITAMNLYILSSLKCPRHDDHLPIRDYRH